MIANLHPDTYTAPELAASAGANLPILRRPQWSRWVATVLAVVVVGGVIASIATNSRFEWSVVWHYTFSAILMRGFAVTLEVTFVAMLIGIVIGVIVGALRLSTIPIVAAASWFYVWIFRGVPVLVQLIFWYNISALYPSIRIGLSHVFTVYSFNANSIITPFTAAILGLGLNEGAYMAEIVRGGLLSVEYGQTEAAYSLGMSRRRTLLRIVLPQAMRAIVPVTGNQVINLLKTTALVSVLSLGDVLFAAQNVYTKTFQTIPLLIAASLWYIIGTSVLSVGQYYVERHFARGHTRQSSGGALGRARKSLLSTRDVARRLVGVPR